MIDEVSFRRGGCTAFWKNAAELRVVVPIRVQLCEIPQTCHILVRSTVCIVCALAACGLSMARWAQSLTQPPLKMAMTSDGYDEDWDDMEGALVRRPKKGVTAVAHR